eukprot:3024622-Rhodomonas_salina.1
MAMAAAQLSSCWNCGDQLHKKMDCPNLPQQPANPFQRSVNKPAFGRGFGGAGGFGGRGMPGGGGRGMPGG